MMIILTPVFLLLLYPSRTWGNQEPMEQKENQKTASDAPDSTLPSYWKKVDKKIRRTIAAFKNKKSVIELGTHADKKGRLYIFLFLDNFDSTKMTILSQRGFEALEFSSSKSRILGRVPIDNFEEIIKLDFVKKIKAAPSTLSHS